MCVLFSHRKYVVFLKLVGLATAMRVKDSVEQLSYLRQASAAGHVDFVYECLDALGETPWRINHKVLKVVLEVWNGGQAIGGIPPAQYVLLINQT